MVDDIRQQLVKSFRGEEAGVRKPSEGKRVKECVMRIVEEGLWDFKALSSSRGAVGTCHLDVQRGTCH